MKPRQRGDTECPECFKLTQKVTVEAARSVRDCKQRPPAAIRSTGLLASAKFFVHVNSPVAILSSSSSLNVAHLTVHPLVLAHRLVGKKLDFMKTSSLCLLL